MTNKHLLSEKIEVKIYLKHKLRPFVMIFDNNHQKENFLQAVRTEDVITIGPITFLKNEIKYIILE